MISIYKRIIHYLIFNLCCGLNSQIEAIRCYQCGTGPRKLCTYYDSYPVACSTGSLCAHAKIIQTFYVLEWRGCVTPEQDLNIANNLASFGDEIFGQSLTTAMSYSSCSSNMCNRPRFCYQCTAGSNRKCLKNDTAPFECNSLAQVYCGTLRVEGDFYWLGCLNQTEANALSEASEGSELAYALNRAVYTNIQTAKKFEYCANDFCNDANQLRSFNFVILVILLFPLYRF